MLKNRVLTYVKLVIYLLHTNQHMCCCHVEPNSQSESRGTAEESDESISDVINALTDNGLDLRYAMIQCLQIKLSYASSFIFC